MNSKTIYITGYQGRERQYEAIGKKLKQLGYEYFISQPTEEPFEANLKAYRESYNQHMEKLEKCSLVIAYVGVLFNTHTQMEIEHAGAMNIPVVVYYESTCKVSPLILGNPAVKCSIQYDNEKVLIEKYVKDFILPYIHD